MVICVKRSVALAVSHVVYGGNCYAENGDSEWRARGQ